MAVVLFACLDRTWLGREGRQSSSNILPPEYVMGLCCERKEDPCRMVIEATVKFADGKQKNLSQIGSAVGIPVPFRHHAQKPGIACTLESQQFHISVSTCSHFLQSPIPTRAPPIPIFARFCSAPIFLWAFCWARCRPPGLGLGK